MFDPRTLQEFMPTSPADAIGKYYGKLVLPALQLPRKAALAPFGGADAVDQWFQNSQNNVIREFEDTPGLFRPGLSFAPKNPVQYALAKSGVSNLGFDLLTDPLTYAGGIGAIPKVGKPALNLLNRGINEALLAPAKVPMRALSVPLPGFGLGKHFSRVETDPLTDGLVKHDAQSIGDYLWGGPSRASQLHNFANSVQDMAERLMGRGHDLELDMADFANARAGNVVPAYDPRTAKSMVTALRADNDSRLATLAPDLATAIKSARTEHIRAIDPSLPPEEIYARAYKVMQASDDLVNRAERGSLTPDQILDAFDRRVSALDFLESGRTGILADVPEAMRPRAEAVFGSMQDHGQQLFRDRETLEAGLRELWELRNAQSGGTLGAYRPISRAATGDDLVTELNVRLKNLGLDDIIPTSESPASAQLRSRLVGQIPDTTLGKLDDALKVWGASGDPLTDNPYKLVFDRTIRDRAEALGLGPNDTPVIGSALNWLNQATTLWKTIQLMSPSYLSTNAISGMASSALAGVDPRGIQRNLLGNLFKMLRGEFSEIPEIQAQNARLGVQTPAGLTGSTGFLQDANELRDMSGRGVDVLQKIGAGRMAGIGALQGGAAGYGAAQATPEDDTLGKTALGTATGALTFGTMPWLSRRLYQPLAQGTEQVLRQSAGVLGREEFLEQALPQMDAIITNATRGSGIAPDVVTNMLDSVADRAGMVSSKELDQLLAGAGITPEIRRQAVEQWDTLLAQADEAAVSRSNAINFDYRNLTNFEEFTRQVFPFSTWATKAFPFFAARIAENPIIGSTIARYAEESENARRDQGLSGRFAGTSEIPAAQALWEVLTGREGQRAFFNPARGFLPASDALRAGAFERDPGTGTAWQSLTDLTDRIGLNPHFGAGLLARVSGQEGTDPSSGPFPVRQAGPIQALTGIDLNQPGRSLETAVRRGLGQPEVSDPVQQAALRRIDELALRNTGMPITAEDDPRLAPYLRAKVERSGPLWEQAVQETTRERTSRSLVGFGSQFLTPQATLGTEEARISQARANSLIPAELSREITAASQRAPHTDASQAAISATTQAALELVARNRPDLNGQLPPEVQTLLANPTWQNIDRLRDMIVDAQSQNTPEMRGYAGSGSPRKQRIQHAVQLYQDSAALALEHAGFRNTSREEQNRLLSMLEAYPRYPRDVQRSIDRNYPGLVRARGIIQKERERLLRENPDLQAYFDYRQRRGADASLEEFVSQ